MTNNHKPAILISMKNQKTFSDLEFNDHPNNPDGIQARLDLGNGFEISVVSMRNKEKQFGGLYGNASKGTYEVAMFHNDSMLPLASFDDVLGWQDADAITRLMREAQTNGVAWVNLLQEIRKEHNEELFAD